MKTDGDYLWDRSGEPDPEIQQLEEILGTLRYQPRPLEIPAGLQIARKRNLFRHFGPRLAIAATIAMLLLGLGVWLGLQRTRTGQLAVTPKTSGPGSEPNRVAVPSTNQAPDPKLAVSSAGSNEKLHESSRRRFNQRVIARQSNRLRNPAEQSPQLAENQREGQAAKDKLMLALRLASAKLSFVQKKMQGASPRDIIHNQHKIG